jgi:hypothetical protein
MTLATGIADRLQHEFRFRFEDKVWRQAPGVVEISRQQGQLIVLSRRYCMDSTSDFAALPRLVACELRNLVRLQYAFYRSAILTAERWPSTRLALYLHPSQLRPHGN